MSDSVEVFETFEITDTSIAVDAISELKDKEIIAAAPEIIESTTTTKRPLENDGDEIDEKAPVAKKVCTETEGEEEEEAENLLDESKVEDVEEDLSVLDKNISDEVLEKSSETIDDEDVLEELPSQEIEDEEEDIAEESFECQDEEEEELEEEGEGTSDDDEEMMARALQSAKSVKQPAKFFEASDEPIALDDSDDDEEEKVNEMSQYKSDSSEYSVDNNVIGESDDEADEIKEILRFRSIQLANKPSLVMTRRILKKSRKIFMRKRVERVKVVVGEGSQTVETEEKTVEEEKPVEEEVEPMEVTEEEEIPQKSPPQAEPTLPPAPSPAPEVQKTEEKSPVAEENPPEIKANPPENNVKPPETEKIDPPPQIIPTESSFNLLTEIQNSPIDEIFNRYVLKSAESSPTLDEFNEELFFCLQQNKLEIEKATQLWNEKLHVKYKIRELMETIRRHRAVMEIETFGKIPENSNSNHPVISSKSSTTTNSEADNFEKQLRMSSDSVNRLIQDVRATMLKRDEKNDESFNSVQQGRQGQIIDVQSIINDFRQKNPQEIPRRGRRMKNSFGFDNHEFGSNGHEMKASASGGGGYPEVSLHPVHNLYKNLGNAQGTPHFSGQKSSLLQSILTKQSTKSPASSFHSNHSLPTTSTLARLLTAPERSIHGSQKQTAPSRQSTKSHNGEITITPIGMNNNNLRNKDYSMDDEDNSMEPPLVIDESEDFDTSGKNVTDLLCQGCKKNKAFFMCAGCSRQWYCSKECQEMAWDEHAEDCMI